MKRALIALCLLGVIYSCSNGKNKDVEHDLISSNIKMLKAPVGDSCAEPNLFTDKNGIVFLSWIEKKNEQNALKFSSLTNDKWSSPVTIASGNDWFVNWADYPVIATDGNINLLAHYLQKSDPGKFTYDVKLVSSNDSGKTWSNSKKLNEDNVKAEHGFVSMLAYKDQFFVTWLDGRKTGEEEEHSGHDHHGEMSLRAAFIDKNGNKTNEWELDNRVCDCCQTTAVITSNGPVVFYRDRSDDEIRDISVVRYKRDEWTLPRTVFADNWQIKGCPVNGPRADALNNNLVVAWFSNKDNKAEVKVAFSNNGGVTFNDTIRIDEDKPIGRVDVAMLDSLSAMVSWMEGSSIKARKVYANGKKDPPLMIASSSEARSSGFPQMTKAGNKLFFAWTDDKAKTIHVAQMDL